MTPGSMVIVTGSVTADPDHVQEVERHCLAHTRRSRTEAGCMLHSVHRDVENAQRFVFLEYWRSRADLEQHFAVPASADFLAALRPLCSAMEAIEIYEVTPSPT